VSVKQKVKHLLFNPISRFGRYRLLLKKNADLYQLKEIKVNTIWNSLYSDIRKITMCMFLTELTRKVLNKYENHDEEYIILFNILKDLENHDDNWSLHIWYLLQLQQIQGISILRHPIESGNYFDIVLQQMK
jgi:recombinational DNA repair protein (RecF pathway)